MRLKIKYFLYSLATDQKKSFIFWPIKFILFLLSLIYGQGLKFVISLYQRQWVKPKKINALVISVGNITLGGTGKTPFVFYLAKKIENYGRKVAIATRGYGEDEKFMFQQDLAHIPLLAGRNRVKNANLAISKDNVDVLLLDDAMQQWGIYKDLEIVVIDSGNPFGNGYLLPRGICREPLFSLRRAHIFVITKLDKGLTDLANLRHTLVALNPKALILETIHEAISLYDFFTEQILDLSFIKNKKVILVSALGDNEYFRYSVEKLEAKVSFHFSFIDHYEYQKDDWLKIVNKAQKEKIDLILTTSKDMVKLKKVIKDNNLFLLQIKLLVLNIELKILKGEELLNDRLFSLFSS
jgi:tetraacyldisaccharide 4'-kinase